MAFSMINKQGRQVLKFEGAATIRQAQELASQLGELPEEAMPVEVDTSLLEDMDTSILQLLCSLRKTVPTLIFNDPSKVFVAMVDRCGLRRELLGLREGM